MVLQFIEQLTVAKIMWLPVSSTNKNPRIVCNYYMDQIENAGIPRLVAIDPGSENGIMSNVHTLLRSNHNVTFSDNPVRIGSSVHNVRIERFWGYLRPAFTQFYMDLFKDMKDSGVLNVADVQHIECLQFCFTRPGPPAPI